MCVGIYYLGVDSYYTNGEAGGASHVLTRRGKATFAQGYGRLPISLQKSVRRNYFIK
jgi:hypothetical protein